MRDEKNKKIPETLLFGPLRYDLKAGKLEDAQGKHVHLRSQSAEVLSILSQKLGEMTPKEQLIEQVWPDVITTDDSLVQCISDIRRALGREAVKTFPKKGYLLLPTSIEYANDSNPLPLRVIWVSLVVGLVVLAVLLSIYERSRTDFEQQATTPPFVATEKTLAVLPFVNVSNDAEMQFFSDGLGEDLTTDLSNVNGLTVISYASSFKYPNAESGLKKIAGGLGVRYLVRGTVRQHTDGVRINVSLIDPLDGFNIWAERYDIKQSNPFDMQGEITNEIISSLSLSKNAVELPQQRVEFDAYYMLLRGLEPLRMHTTYGNQEAREYFERALMLDPQYARAHASIALTHGRDAILQSSDEISKPSIETGLQSAVTAIQLDPDIPHAYLALGLLNLAIEEYDNALAAARQAIKLNKNFSEGYALLAEIALYGGDLQEGLTSIRRAKLLHPRHPPSYHWIEGHILFLQGRFDNARPFLEESAELGPHFYRGLLTLAANYGQQGNKEAAQQVLANAKAVKPELEPVEFAEKIRFRVRERSEAFLSGLRKASRIQ